MRPMNILIISLGIMALMMLPACAAGTPFSISGKVIDALGDPVQGANVTIIDNAYRVIGSTLTNENGIYTLDNLTSLTDTVTARVTYREGNKTYKVPDYFVRWYQSSGAHVIPATETQFTGYPEPDSGYLYGVIRMPGSDRDVDGTVYLSNATWRGSKDVGAESSYQYQFHVPAGTYDLYAAHVENGIRYESGHRSIEVKPLWFIEGTTATILTTKPLVMLPTTPWIKPPHISTSPSVRIPFEMPAAQASPEHGALALGTAAAIGLICVLGSYLMLRRYLK